MKASLKSYNLFLVSICLSTLALIFCSVSADAQVRCGDRITDRAMLISNLSCSTNPALTVADNGYLNLNGFTVNCKTSKNDGIVLDGKGAQLRSGKVTGCIVGIKVGGTGDHHVSDIISDNNSTDGFYVTSHSNVIENSTSYNNGRNGITLSNKFNKITNSIVKKNRNDGILVNQTDHNLISDNLISDNKNQGISIKGDLFYFSSKNKITKNIIKNNHNGIKTNMLADENEISGNKVQNNTHIGIWIDSNDELISGNVISDNGKAGILMDDRSEECIVSGNKVYNHEDEGIFLTQYAEEHFIHGNTNSTNPEHAIVITGNSNDSLISK